MNSDEEILEIAQRLTTCAWWIQSNHFTKVYFSNCVVCGAAIVSKQPTKLYCSQKCNTYQTNHVTHDGMKTWDDMMVCPTARSITGVRGVKWYEKVCTNNIIPYVMATIMVHAKSICVYHGNDFFEACCARKSADNRRLKGEEIRAFQRKKIVAMEPYDTRIGGVTVRANRYVASANINGENKTLGRFIDFFEACCARKSAEARYRKSRVNKNKNNKTGILGVFPVGTKYRSRINFNGKVYRSTHDDYFEACCARKSYENSIVAGNEIRIHKYERINSICIKPIDTRIEGVRATENRYVAKATVHGKVITLGRFTDFFEACCARKSAEAKPKKYKIHKGRPNKFGIIGVTPIAKDKYRSRITVNGKPHTKYHDDFFEAVCARKSAEARIAQGTCC